MPHSWLLKSCLVLGAIGFVFPAFSAMRPYSPQRVHGVARDIDALMGQVDPQYPWAAMVMDATTGQLIYSHRSDEWMTPASTNKVVTAIAAVKELGANYRFKTKLFTHGDIDHGVLHGSVTLRFAGDPVLTHTDIKHLLAKLKQAGIHRITGSVRLDQHLRSSIPYGPGWMWDDLSYGYSAPTGAMIIDKNSFLLTVGSSTSHIDGRPLLKTQLPAGVVRLYNHAHVTRQRSNECPLLVYSSLDDHYNFSGCVPKTRQPRYEKLAIRNPTLYATALVKEGLQELHIPFNGRVRVRRTQPHSELLATHESPPLSHLVHDMLKESDNMIANALLEAVGAHHYHEQGSWDNGSRAVKAILSPILGFSASDWRIVDGSGASRYDLLSSRVLVTLLQAVYAEPKVASVIMPALPSAGKDGTLAGRMRASGVRGKVHAKTGTMTGVSALTGFVQRSDKHVWVFAVMTNGLVHKASMAHAWEDALCQLLSQRRSSGTRSLALQ